MYVLKKCGLLLWNPSILMWGIIGYEICLRKNNCSLIDLHSGEWFRYDDKVIAQRKVGKLQAESGLGGTPHII